MGTRQRCPRTDGWMGESTGEDECCLEAKKGKGVRAKDRPLETILAVRELTRLACAQPASGKPCCSMVAAPEGGC